MNQADEINLKFVSAYRSEPIVRTMCAMRRKKINGLADVVSLQLAMVNSTLASTDTPGLIKFHVFTLYVQFFRNHSRSLHHIHNEFMTC